MDALVKRINSWVTVGSNIFARRVFVDNFDCDTKSVTILHIPPTAISNPVEAVIPIHRLGYYNGVIAMTIPATVTGANLLTQIAFSMDGVDFTEYFTLADTAGAVAQTVIIDLAQFEDAADAAGFAKLIHLFPFFKIRLSGGGGTGNIYCDVHMEK